jgi:hypothetical protein
VKAFAGQCADIGDRAGLSGATESGVIGQESQSRGFAPILSVPVDNLDSQSNTVF